MFSIQQHFENLEANVTVRQTIPRETNVVMKE